MAIKNLAPKLSEGMPPSSSIVLDVLLRRYLVSIGLKKYKSLFSVAELQQFALLAVFHAVSKNLFENITVDDFAAWVRPNEVYSHIRILPETYEGRQYAASQLARRQKNLDGEETVVLRGVENVKAYIAQIFIRVINKELGYDKKERDIRKRVEETDPSCVRRASQTDQGFQPLDIILRQLREQREGAEEEAVRFVVKSIQKRMTQTDMNIVDLLIVNEYTPREVARLCRVDVENVYRIWRSFKTKFTVQWHRLFGNY
jgi:hypothetical protein